MRFPNAKENLTYFLKWSSSPGNAKEERFLCRRLIGVYSGMGLSFGGVGGLGEGNRNGLKGKVGCGIVALGAASVPWVLWSSNGRMKATAPLL